jgi:hypothetical protein
MDNGTHTLFGAALAKTKLGRLHRFAPLSLIVGANLPDSDIVFSLFGGKNAFLIHHRGVTHALLGWWSRRCFSRGRCGGSSGGARGRRRKGLRSARPTRRTRRRTGRPTSGRRSSGSCRIRCSDALNTYGIRPWLPFSDARPATSSSSSTRGSG